MKQLIISLLCVFALTAISISQNDQTKKVTDKKETKTIKKAASKRFCPVTGEKAKKNISYTYKGKKYNFCCEGCIEKFEANPGKYIGKNKVTEKCGDHEMTDEKTSAESKELSTNVVNTNCPVMGEPVSVKGGTYEYNGKVYGFCCPGCKGKFAKDPEKYLKKI